MNHSRRSGFSLPAVLAVTGVVTLVFMVAMSAMNSLTAEAASARARVRFLAAAMGIEATTAYMLAAEPLSQTGVAVGAGRIYTDAVLIPTDGDGQQVRLDGRAYVWPGEPETEVRLRDQAGAVNLAYLDENAIRRLAARLGLPDADARTLEARYQDYVDRDDLERVGGAESRAYGGRGPANRAMRTTGEWLSLLGMREAADPRAWRRLQPLLAMDATSSNINVNTADAEALKILFGLDDRRADDIVRLRDATPFMSYGGFARAAGLPVLDEEGFYTFPDGRVLLNVSDRRSAWIYRSRITLTPSARERPFWIDQTELTEAPGRFHAGTSDAVRFPYAPR